MANLNDLDDVTISNPKVGDVVKYTATGWQNGADATGSAVGGNPCGDMDHYTRDDRNETITEMWKWEVDTDGDCGIRVENEENVNNLDEYAELCPGRVVVGNSLGRGELKARDLGRTRLSATDILFFQDKENPTGVTLSELVACCDGDGGGGGETPTNNRGFNPIVVNFFNPDPNIGGERTLQYGRTPQNVYIDGVTEDDFDSARFRRDAFDIFDKEASKVTVTMPPGSNRAMMFYTFNSRITSGPLNRQDVEGFSTTNARIDMETNQGIIRLYPGERPYIVAESRNRCQTLGYDTIEQTTNWDATDILRRAPSARSTGNKISRAVFQLSTAENPTTITLRPEITIYRGRGGAIQVGSGRLLIIPWYSDATTDQGPGDGDASGFSLYGWDGNEEEVLDDGGYSKGFADSIESRDLKDTMNYYTNAIRETLDYDESLAEENKPILQQALRDIFTLKQSTETTYDYYWQQLATIRGTVLPYVGFTFGFEDSNALKSF